MMSQRLACEAADLFAAAAPVSGTLNYFDCQPAVPIAILEFHGTADQSVPYDGGMGQKSLAQINFTSVSYSIDFWVKQNGCPASPQTSTENGITHDVYAPCKQGAAVELYTIKGGGHAWPGGRTNINGDAPDSRLNASELIWQFFAAHPKP